MFRHLFATPVSLALALSFLLGGFEATASPLLNRFTPIKPLPLPSAVISSTKGQQSTLAELVKSKNGKGPVLIHLWATRCGPCQPEMKELSESIPALTAKGVKVLAIAQEAEGLVSVPAFLRRHSLSDNGMYVDPTLALAQALVTDGLPSTFLVDSSGNVTGVHSGPLDWAALAR